MSIKKPYALSCKEFGRGKPTITKFATLSELAKAINEQWQGAEYIDGSSIFHTDFCTFSITGAELSDLGRFFISDDCRDFSFHSHLLNDVAKS
jgi:hypothetical protein